MALADYDTSAEKIAALRAALIDPALIQIATSDFITTENIYEVTKCRYINSLRIVLYQDHSSVIPSKIPIGTNLSGIEPSYIYLYIKDSDIVYGNPIDTYQDRLVKIIEADIKVEEDRTVVNAGAYGSMVKSLSNTCVLNINSKQTMAYQNGATSFQIVIPNGNTFESDLGTDAFEYIDLPADW